ncbi:hypothetical protein [Halospeciosus flavus]|uniref:GTPase n=1 Tax=Halospeciosus flavus TaxID=3032283 RepID=A0ABD5Z1I8_9EURY|nr:hypothetical protein [Halospeciosus flavus]
MNEDEVEVTRVVIMGAFGRDFHDFITVFRDDPSYRVVAFTQHGGQNLGETRDGGHDVFPAELAGPHHDADIPIEPESDLERVVDEYDADEVVFSYSDVSHEDVMHQASRAMASGANFRLLGPEDIEVEVDAPVLAVDAVRTGCGKSQLSRALAEELHDRGLEAVVVREPMPYAEDLAANAVQRFETFDDLDAADVTIEEREEYEQHIERGHVVYAGVDYPEIFERAAAEGDVVVWDGGNNELPFADPDLHFVLADPLRADDTDTSHPGETNLRRADAVVVNKENSASREQVTEVVARVHEANRDADVYHADSVVTVEDPEAIEGRDVLVVEDGPTLTHGDADYGAGTVAARKYNAAELLDPRDAAVGSIADVFENYPHLEHVLPAMGYSDEQIRELEQTIEGVDPDVVVAGTPHDLGEQVDVSAPIVRVRYRIDFHDTTPSDLLDRYADRLGL